MSIPKEDESTPRNESSIPAPTRSFDEQTVEDLMIAAYMRGAEWAHENQNEASGYLIKAARDYADYTMAALYVGHSPAPSTEHEIRNTLTNAWNKAARELDMWRCPECGKEAQLSGAVHIEWGNPECDNHGDRRVLMTLIDIRTQPSTEVDADQDLDPRTPEYGVGR